MVIWRQESHGSPKCASRGEGPECQRSSRASRSTTSSRRGGIRRPSSRWRASSGSRRSRSATTSPATPSSTARRPARIRALAEEAGVRILSINALQRFNDWRGRAGERGGGARRLCRRPAAPRRWCWCRATTARRRTGCMRRSRGCGRSCASRRLVGLVEPLGFATCALRLQVGGRARRSPRSTAATLPAGPRHLPSPSRRRGGALSRADRARAHLRRGGSRRSRWRRCATRTGCW